MLRITASINGKIVGELDITNIKQYKRGNRANYEVSVFNFETQDGKVFEVKGHNRDYGYWRLVQQILEKGEIEDVFPSPRL